MTTSDGSTATGEIILLQENEDPESGGLEYPSSRGPGFYLL